jgi:hypothetical protein
VTAATTARPAKVWRPTRWELETLRAGKAFRDANPSATPEGRSEDAALDGWLARAEAAYASTGAAVDTTQDAGELPTGPTGGGSGASNYSQPADGPTGGQLSYLASLARDLGRELETPRDKRHASRIIDAAKAELARRPAAARPVRPATEGQINYLRALVAERDTPVDPECADRITAEVTGFELASRLIEQYKAMPRRAAAVPTHGIREGRYGFTPDGGTTTEFYRVTRTGRIKVWTAGGEWPYNGKLNAALTWVKDNQRDAAILFGRLTETCGRCGRDLSDDDSRARGLGPDCAKKAW